MQQSWRRKGVAAAVAVATAAFGAVATSPGAQATDDPLDRAAGLRLDEPITGTAPNIDERLVGASGTVEVSIRLTEPSIARGGNAATIAAQQAAAIAAVEGAGGTVDGTVDTVLNAVFATIDVDAVDAIVAAGSVFSVNAVADYELDLTETVPYIGATGVQDGGNTGEGIRVAVLDSGVDYTHADLGGDGTDAAYEAAFGVGCAFNAAGTLLECESENFASRDGLFPTDKVVEGFDFVGEEWPNGDRTEDDDPIDYEGHGTHVADIIAGRNGVAPGADIIAVKVCSAVSSSCNGVALIKGVEYAVDQGADIINMSLGSLYGQAFDDDLSAATDGATAAGALSVVSAGNSANKPYVTGSPAASPTALSVAQTQVPSARLPFLTVLDGAGEEAATLKAVFQDWSAEPTEVTTGPLQYGDGAGGNLDGCAAFDEAFVDPADPLIEPPVVLVDRGSCAFTQKIANIANAGGIIGIIGLIAPGDPFTGGYDGAACDPDGDGELNCDDIPGYMISQADSNLLKSTSAAGDASLLVDPAIGADLVGTLVGSSSRGPTLNYNNLLKPEIGAPGASISAEAGTGTGVTPFGGTSGAAPMVSGSAALVLADRPDLAPLQVKALLVNSAETEIRTDDGPTLAPITRIGGGEVRVDRAVATDGAAWVVENGAPSPVLSYGFVDVTGTYEATKTVTVENYGDSDVTYSIQPTFRYDNDAALGAVTPSLSTSSVTVPAGGSATFDVTLTIDGAQLPTWTGSSGLAGASPEWLDFHEQDGYVFLDAGGDADDIHVPWHVLPRKAADIDVDDRPGKRATLTNEGVGTGNLEIYNLLATSDDLPEGPRGGQAPTPDIRAAGVAFFPGTFAGCASDVFVAFAVNTWEPQVHANAPALFEFQLDVDGDGINDYAVYNADLSLLGGAFTLGDGRNVVYAQDLATGAVSVFFGVDHDTNSTNTVLYACGEQIGLTADVINRNTITATFAADIYFGGPGDAVATQLGGGVIDAPLTVDGAKPRFLTVNEGESVDVRLDSRGKGKGALVLVRGGAAEEAFIFGK